MPNIVKQFVITDCIKIISIVSRFNKNNKRWFVTFLWFLTFFQGLPSLHTQCNQHSMVALPMRVGRWCRKRYPNRQQDDTWTIYPSVWERQGSNRCWKSHGGYGSNASLARIMATRHTVLRWCAIRNAVSYSARKHI